ncbi:MAG: hypothetical protein U0Q16_27765 [Bryobacteraceae bacterium]
MKRIAVLYGMENTFPPALVECINSRKVDGVTAEHLKVSHSALGAKPAYDVIVDRISHDIPFYRSYLKHAAIEGAVVINNPFWWSADDKFVNYVLAHKLGVAVPPTVILPHKDHPPGTTSLSMRNLEYPVRWAEIFDYVGFPAFLKPISGGGWKNVYPVASPADFFSAYDQTGDLPMCLQRAVRFNAYFRCYVVGQEQVRVMVYDPRQPHHMRYVRDPAPVDTVLYNRVVGDALKLCRALGYDFNTVEFAVENGVPYAIDFMNPVPDADMHSVGEDNFRWVVGAVADLAIRRALEPPQPVEYRWAPLLAGHRS